MWPIRRFTAYAFTPLLTWKIAKIYLVSSLYSYSGASATANGDGSGSSAPAS
jgi:hypothetical protein